MSDKKEAFYTSGTESFQLKGQEKDPDRVVLNIQNPEPAGIVLEGKKKKHSSGNFLFDIFYRLNNYLIEHSTVKVAVKANFFHLLAVMLNAGISTVKALKSLSQQSESPRMKMILEDMVENVEGGSSFSEAMLIYPDVFSEKEIGMVQSGEVSGQLIKVLESLARDSEKETMIKSKVRGAMMYPLVVFVLLIAVVVAMMVFVVPKLTELFESTQNELPLVTRIVVAISDFMVNSGLFLAGGLLTLLLILMIFKRTDAGSYFFDNLKIKMPLFGKLFQKTYLSRFARSLSNLLESGVSIVKTMDITASSIGNDVYKKSLLLSMEDIKQGIPLAENLNENKLFPPMLVNMIEVGEKTARLDEVCNKVANFYDAEVEDAVNGLSKIIEPVILIIIGTTVATVVAAIMLPIMELSNVASNL